MLALGSLAFLSPWLLVALAALPIIWWLLRVTPPAPRRIAFPAIRLLLGLMPREETPARTPLWLILLRMLLAALVILAVAHPLLNPQARLASTGPIVLVVDDGWAAAQFGERAERPLEIVVFSEQRLPFGVGRRDDADRAPAPPLVDQQHRAGGLIAFDLDPGHAVAQLAGHRQTKLGTLCPRLDCRRLPRDQAAVVTTRPYLKEARRRCRQRPQHNPDIVRFGVPGRQHDRGVRRLRRQIAQAPPLDELSRQRLIAAISRDAVAEPDG